MSSIKQQIPSYIQGMSDQPDELKKPGQLRGLTNAIPDVAIGLQKRPGIEFVSDLPDADPDGKWFNIFAENSLGFEEQYICNITREGVVRIWAAVDIKNAQGNVIIAAGSPVPTSTTTEPQPLSNALDQTFYSGVRNPTSEIDYFKHLQSPQLQVLNVGATTLVTNRTKTPTMSANEVGFDKYEGFISLQTLDYGRTYGINITGDGGSSETFTSATSLSLINGTDSHGSSEDDCRFAGTKTFIGYDSGSGKDLTFRLTQVCTIIPAKQGSGYDSEYRTSVTLLNGGTGWQTGQTFSLNWGGYDRALRVNSVSSSTTENVLAAVRVSSTIFGEGSQLSADTVLSELKSELQGTGIFDEVTIIGSGLYVSSTRQFNLQSIDEQLLTVFSSTTESADDPTPGSRYTTVNNVSLLPNECKNGLVVKVANSFSGDDDYYLKFMGNDGSDGGGVWEETFKPGILITFNSGSMPHMIRRTLDSTGNIVFQCGSIQWIDRSVGDDNTNPVPSFVYTNKNKGVTINNMLLYRNRLVFLSSNNVILTQSGDLANWFSDTALVLRASDPIDINAAVDTSTALYAGIVVNNGMLLFSRFNQFLFTTDSDILSPDTAKSTLLSTYDFNTNSNPFNLAGNVGFFSSSGNDSIFWWMKDILREGPPVVDEVSKSVSRSLPTNLDLISASREDGLVLASTKGTSTIWGYKFFLNGPQLLQSAWFKWEIPGEMLYHYNNARGTYYIIYKDSLGVVSQCKIDLRDKLRATTVEGLPYEYYVYLDNWVSVRPVYNSGTKLSVFDIPFTPTKTIQAYSLDTDNYRGRSAKPEIAGKTGTLPGDWSDADVAIGYEYEMKIDMPTIFVTAKQGESFRSDTSSSLTIHRVQMNFGTVGMYTVNLKRYGKDDYSMTYESTEMDGYDADRPSVYADKIYTIPVYDRNHNCTLSITSSHPTPATFYSLTFEGDYTPMYYKSV